MNQFAKTMAAMNPEIAHLLTSMSRNPTVTVNQTPASTSIEQDKIRRQQADMDRRQEQFSQVPRGLQNYAPLVGVIQGIASNMQRTKDEGSLEDAYGRYQASMDAKAQQEAQAAQQAKQEAQEASLLKHQRAMEQEQSKQRAIAENREVEPEGPAYDADQENKLRKEYGDITKAFGPINDSFGRVKASLEKPTAAGDLALIFNYMKILDPGSTVREGEFAQAAASGGYGERLKAAGQSILSGQRLSDAQRADFGNRAGMLYNEALQGYDKRTKTFEDVASQYDARPEAVISDKALYRGWDDPVEPPEEEPVSYNEGQTVTNPETGERLTFSNGEWVPI